MSLSKAKMKIVSYIIFSSRTLPTSLVSTEIPLNMPQGYADFKKLEKHFLT